MGEQVLLGHVDVHEHLAHQLCIAASRVIADDDVLELGNALLYAGMVSQMAAGQLGIGDSGGELARKQVFHVGVDVGVLVCHVIGHLSSIFVVKAEDEQGNLVARGAVECFNEPAADARQAEVHKIGVRILEIADKIGKRYLLGHLVDMSVGRVLEVIDNRQEGGHLHTRLPARLGHRLVAKAQRDAKAAYHLQHAVIVADDIAHRVVLVIFLCHAFYVLYIAIPLQIYNLFA